MAILSSLIGTQFLRNSTASYGGGATIQSNEVHIVNALFAENTSDLAGAGIDLDRGRVDVVNTTFANPIHNSHAAILNEGAALHVTDTIFVNHSIGIASTDGTVAEDYNLYYGNITNTYGVTMGAHSLIGDPRFVDPTHDDYHLTVGSAAIDHGVDAGVTSDLDGNPRPIGNGFDIGAYEYQSVVYRAFLPIIRQ